MWNTFGHDKAVTYLQCSLATGRMSHAYLLSGRAGVGKMTLALDLARALNCTDESPPCGRCDQCSRVDRSLHADVRVVGLETQDSGRQRAAISIDQVREVQREASLRPFEGRHRVLIFDGAEHMSEEAANCLLKTLEEPPDQVVLLLLTCDYDDLLPTIVSRCQLLELRPVPIGDLANALEQRHEVDPERAGELARLSEGRPGWAVRAAGQEDLIRRLTDRLDVIERVVGSGLEGRFAYAAEMALTFGRNRDSAYEELSLWLKWWRDILLVSEGVPDAVTNVARLDWLRSVAAGFSSAQVAGAVAAIHETVDNLNANVNPRLALDNLMLALPRP